MIAPNSHDIREGRRERSMEEFEGRGRGMVQISRQHVAPCALKRLELVLGRRGLRMVAVFWAGIPIEVTQEAGVVPRCRLAAIGTPF